MKYFIKRLGCPKNDVDADYIAARLEREGHEAAASADEADTVIVNTCGFILPAREESINNLIDLSQLKEKGKLKSIYVSGCLSQRHGDELLKEMPELDGAFGLGELDSLASAVSSGKHLTTAIRTDAERLDYLDYERRQISDTYPYAYLKISDGCDRACTFCAIPGMRGKYRSRTLMSIVEESRFLADNGKRELILVSQEATIYGHDLQRKSNLIRLLKALDKIEKVDWIRLLYLYPTQVSQQLIEYVAADNKTLQYFDIPLQHICDDLLKMMNRRGSRKSIEGLLTMIRKICPEATIRTSFIVGFPGETEEHFEELCEFVQIQQFDRLGVFTYSPEEGTEAEKLADRPSHEIALERMDRLMTIQGDLAFEKNNSLIGTVKEVIIDSLSENGLARGRTSGDCPEVDQEVIVSGDNLVSGTIYKVRIDSSEGYDLHGSVLGVET